MHVLFLLRDAFSDQCDDFNDLEDREPTQRRERGEENFGGTWKRKKPCNCEQLLLLNTEAVNVLTKKKKKHN